MDVVGTLSPTSPHLRRRRTMALALMVALLAAGIALIGLVSAQASSPCRGGAVPTSAGCRPGPHPHPVAAPGDDGACIGDGDPLTTGGRRPAPGRHVHGGAVSPASPAPDTTASPAAAGTSPTTLVPPTGSSAAISPPDSATPTPADTAPSTTTSTMPPTTTTTPVFRSSVRDQVGDDRS